MISFLTNLTKYTKYNKVKLSQDVTLLTLKNNPIIDTKLFDKIFNT